MGSSEGQTYCLRWNNHKSNLVEILDALIKMECYVDCTIVVDDQKRFKAHRVVLAANSPYFQAILQDVPMDHCSILFPGVKEFEMRALLEYMYTGEVNVTQSQIPRIMKIAEQLEVKGLFDMTDLKGNFDKMEDSISHPSNPPHTPISHPAFPLHSNNSTIKQTSHSSPITSSNNVTSAAQSSSSSPPYSDFKPYSSIYSRARSPAHTPVTDRPPAPWPMPSHLESPIPSHQGLLSRVYETGTDMNPLKRKKLQSINSMLSSSAAPGGVDTPILRNVLAQPNAADSSQPMPLVCQPINERNDRSNNGSNGTDYSEKKYRPPIIDEPHSPYTDRSFDEDSGMDQSQNFGSEPRIASYVPQQNQKPEWKRYKQYTRNDILSAIECVKSGMSALQASRKFGVPSRTLYDKVKKMGITTGRPMNRTMKRSPSSGGGGGNSAQFPFGLSGTTNPYSDMQVPSQQHPHDEDRELVRSFLGPSLLQHALDVRGGDISHRDAALHALAFAAAANAAANGINTSPGTHGNARSPSPNLLMKYMRPSSAEIKKERINHNQMQPKDSHHSAEEEDDKVEDLSISRNSKEMPIERTPSIEPMERSPSPPMQSSTPLPRPESRDTQSLPAQPPPLPQHGVIVPPLSKVIQQLKERRYEQEFENKQRERTECEVVPKSEAQQDE